VQTVHTSARDPNQTLASTAEQATMQVPQCQ
jgi:hypothetical protein